MPASVIPTQPHMHSTLAPKSAALKSASLRSAPSSKFAAAASGRQAAREPVMRVSASCQRAAATAFRHSRPLANGVEEARANQSVRS